MKKLGTSQIVLALVLFTGGLTVVGNGCSRFIAEPEQTSSSENNGQDVLPETGGSGNGEIPVIPGTKTLSLIYAAQALDHFAVCSGLRVPSARTIANYNIKKSSMSSTGQVNTLTAAGMMSTVSTVSDVCDDLIAQDIRSPRLFVNFNMAANSLPSDVDISNAASRLAISCWERKPDSQEAVVLLNMIKASVAATEQNASRKSALLLCTTVLTSLEALLN